MKPKVILYYNARESYIVYQKGNLIIGTLLYAYESIIKILDFKDGLLTLLMKKGNKEIEEFVDFANALSLINLASKKKEYFDGINKEDFIVKEINNA